MFIKKPETLENSSVFATLIFSIVFLELFCQYSFLFQNS